MRPYATSACGLKLLVHEALADVAHLTMLQLPLSFCTSVSGLKLLVHAVLSLSATVHAVRRLKLPVHAALSLKLLVHAALSLKQLVLLLLLTVLALPLPEMRPLRLSLSHCVYYVINACRSIASSFRTLPSFQYKACVYERSSSS